MLLFVKACCTNDLGEHAKCGIICSASTLESISSSGTTCWLIHNVVAPSYLERGIDVSLMHADGSKRIAHRSCIVTAVGTWLECVPLTLHDFQENSDVHKLQIEDLRSIAGAKKSATLATIFDSCPLFAWLLQDVHVVPRLVVPAPLASWSTTLRSPMVLVPG